MQELKQKQLNAYQNTIKKEQDEIVLQYMPALRAMAYKLKERLPPSIDVNDLIGIGVEEMIKLSRRYDKDQNDSFWGYGRKRIYGAMLDFLRELDVISRADRKLVKSINLEIDIYFNEHEEEPSDEYLAQKLGEDVEKIREARGVSSIITILPIDEQIELYGESDVEYNVEKEDLIEKIEEVLKGFDKRDQLIVQLYYYEELNLKEISEIMQISESRISQIHKRLLGKIRSSLGA
ncbi:RNA polymerase sigma factor FliA [Campylobacter sp. RM9344]|uniref:RNA polymerase sigma factor FliA n=1 Tax=Campylobacter californiensis TaxID=1032243 RepID=A0AAW3ZTW0_9BACT|nr:MULTISPECIES: RNA polymerase sigma factor FliA [unclassified Campylobacter]MBE2984372.1 RNA polymerase sigma factor FliA [Campylobacter sp. RM6883]MBE2985710.1 RNA polymerase sigma factor FliA [Campylobacter sp. RM12919]MBE2988770.1 RNA polymerase sigma factor FliA [Campylobacter sp. RM12920]MBE2995807.1 RNA polymerase sigma factor FliA [Campylobacter sp. RM6913]MBE3021758.1 RNA polymerase sigma factor FliA [Campylobacter sp. 7477a]MBE3029638.1 RNA polymerase sigma factor FliA [Campylobact